MRIRRVSRSDDATFSRLAGVDGCRAGWVAVFVRPRRDEVRVRIAARFADVLSAPENSTIIAVDIPIGLPDYLGPDSVALSA
jgi:predicted RNase H-like nuclease